MPIRHALLRAAAATTGGVALALSAAVPANAHVTVTPSTTEAGSYTVLTVSLSHGCEGSPTTKVAVQIPEPILSATPTRSPFWTAETTVEKLDEPVSNHGTTVTERVDTVVFTTDTPLPDGQRDSFEISLKLPDEPGRLVFPAVQTCEKGETAWVEVPTGNDNEELEHPAPTIDVTAADASPAGAPVTADRVDHPGSPTVGLLGLGAGLLGIGIGATALVQARRRP